MRCAFYHKNIITRITYSYYVAFREHMHAIIQQKKCVWSKHIWKRTNVHKNDTSIGGERDEEKKVNKAKV